MADKPAASAPQTLLINPLTTPQAATDRQPVGGDDKSLSDIRRSMKRDPDGQGISGLGYDGVLRTFDAERNVLDAVGLSPAQIREYYDGLPLPERLRTADGRNVSRWDMFHPDAENVPKKFTEEEKARILARNEEMAKRGVATCVPGKSADEGGSKA
ncbi:5f4ccfaa-9c53-41fb-b043-8d5b9a86b7f8 [Thermothielavioides terrestris]|nr:5f4ccfaa-9c53-41fb-b043-8d5b9a86b7f8 [Thermothielavioides terrestris]